MSEAQEMYEHAMNETEIDDPTEALNALIASYGRDDDIEDSLEIYKTRFY